MNPVITSFAFLVVNALILWIILYFNLRSDGHPDKEDTQRGPDEDGSRQRNLEESLSASHILGWEFEYARTSASEAMRDRHTMVNYYLIIVGIVASGVIAVLKAGDKEPRGIATILLWILCGVGWLYFLKLVRLRQAWHDSAQAMNQIKNFCIEHAEEFTPKQLWRAFKWRTRTLPSPHKLWTLYFYSAMLIGFLDTIAYVAGGALLCLESAPRETWPWLYILSLVVFGLIFFSLHVLLYYFFLRPSRERDE